MSTCRSCAAEIRWVYTESGARMPIDALPTADGNLIVDNHGVAHVITLPLVGPPAAGRARYVSHFATCNSPLAHRRRATKRPQPHNEEDSRMSNQLPPVSSEELAAIPQEDIDSFNFEQYVEDSRWVFAKTMAQNPHFYTVGLNDGPGVRARFARAVRWIQEHGQPGRWHGYKFTHVIVGRFDYWLVGGGQICINRKPAEWAGWDPVVVKK